MYYTSKEVYEFISKQTNDPIVEWKTCAISGQPFAIYQSDLDFYAKISPTFAGQKFHIPTPTLCPEERQRRRLSFRNERKLYKRKCDFSGKDIISIYSPDKPYKVYDQKIRWSDERNPMSYGRDFDFSKSFTEQFEQLEREIPSMNLLDMENDICEYTNYTAWSKKVYMCHDVINSEKLLYSNMIKSCHDCLDISDAKNCSNCYEVVCAKNSYQCFFCIKIDDCKNCQFVQNSKNCSHCLFCNNLQNKTYHILNKQVSKDNFDDIYRKIIQGDNDWKTYMEKFSELLNKTPRIGIDTVGCEQCYGNMLFDSKNSILYFESYNNEGCKYGFNGEGNKDCLDVCVCNPNCSLSLEGVSGGEYKNSCYNIACGFIDAVYYSHLCMYSSHCFGCIGLRNKSYCIFNKQYSKEDYEVQVAKIISHMQETGEWGEFFHPSLSPFGYNETVAQEYYPMEKVGTHIHASGDTKKDYSPYGYKRSDYNNDPVIPPGADIVDRKVAPLHEGEGLGGGTDDQILATIYLCEITGRPYRIISQELAFYHKHHLPLPRRHPDQRHADRMALRAPRELHLRTCDQCGQEMLSVYNKEYRSKVYCEKCYQKEIYS